MNFLLPLFIGTSIFGVGVTLIDILGLLGSQFDESPDDGDSDADVDADTDADTDADVDTDADTDSDSDDADDADDADEADDAAEETESEGGQAGQSVMAHDYSPKKNILLKIMTVLRNIVYFCFGFGPVGWFMFGTGSNGVVSLAWAIPMGVLTLAGARLIKRIQRKKLDSQVHESELLMETAEVLVTIEKGRLGKVRILYGNTFVDRYAKARDPEQKFAAGIKVRVVSITDEYVIVSDEE